ncbi:MAG: hypothetical protein RLO46_13215 [Pseudomonadales bacterium]
MDALWVLLITGAVMTAYLVVLLRAAHRGKQWAIDTLKATSCLVEGPGAAPAWLTLEQHKAESMSVQAESIDLVDSELVA